MVLLVNRITNINYSLRSGLLILIARIFNLTYLIIKKEGTNSKNNEYVPITREGDH